LSGVGDVDARAHWNGDGATILVLHHVARTGFEHPIGIDAQIPTARKAQFSVIAHHAQHRFVVHGHI
jgi:hypothetical protein